MSYTPIGGSLRRQVIEMHGTRCLRCGEQCLPSPGSPLALHIDHIIPESLGGLTIIDNLQVLCAICNIYKGATTADYRRYMPGQTPLQKFEQMRFLVPDHVGIAESKPWMLKPEMTDQDWMVLCGCGHHDDHGWFRGLGRWSSLVSLAIPWWRRHVADETGIDPATVPMIELPSPRAAVVLRKPPSAVFLRSISS